MGGLAISLVLVGIITWN